MYQTSRLLPIGSSRLLSLISIKTTQPHPVRQCILTRSWFSHYRHSPKVRNIANFKSHVNEELEAESTERSGHVFTPFRNEAINNLVLDIRSKGDHKDENWTEIQQLMMDSGQSRIEKHWPSLMMNYLLQLNFPQKAESLFDFVLTCDMKPHLALLSMYIALQTKTGNRDEILRAYDLVDSSLLDSESATKIIQGLSTTERWRECLELLSTSGITAKTSIQRHGPVISAAVTHGDMDLAFRLLDEVCRRSDQAPNEIVYDAFLSHANEDTMWKMLLFVGEFGYFMKAPEAAKLKRFLESNDYKVGYARVSRNGACDRCGSQLRRTRLTSTEFRNLKDNFMKKSVVRGDIFIATTPEELRTFENFLQRNPPFDIVIDALNVAHIGRKWDMKIVLKLADLFQRRNKKVLVVSRQHTAKDRWMRQLKCSVFYTGDLSKDDPFVLYAALRSGLQCQIVTRDEMRDHCYLLGEENASLFRKWQRGHQIFLSGARPGGGPNLAMPPNYEVVPQRTGDHVMHIPYDDLDERASYSLPETWLCAKKAP